MPRKPKPKPKQKPKPKPKLRKPKKATPPKPRPKVKRPQPGRVVPKKDAFLAAFKATASLTRAAEAAQVERTLHYRWLREDPVYAAQYRDSIDQAAQVLEDEAVRRAREGTRRIKYWQGEPVGVEIEYSDALMMFLLRGLRPEKYREHHAIEHSGPGGGPIPITDQRLARLTDAELDAFIAVAQKLADSGGPGGGEAAPAAE